jgi:potassium/chloride transporter 9
MFFGVTMPVILSLFSVILFLRMGYILGQSGIVVTILMLLLAYTVVIFTVSSLSAIATSGNIQAGGVYFMISRSLGPEFGGAIGVIFFGANILASALNVTGLVEALFSNFGNSGSLWVYFHNKFGALMPDGIPLEPDTEVYWIRFALATGILVLCGVICLIGAGVFAKATGLIFLAVAIAVTSVMVSYGAMGPTAINVSVPVEFVEQIQPQGLLGAGDEDNTTIVTVYYSSWNLTTFVNNLWPQFTIDLDTGSMANFQIVFGILFTGVTGIMAGANISGDLRHPSTAIPQGTLLALAITFCVYGLIFILSSFTSTRRLLVTDNNYLQDTSVFPPLITLGVFAATFSAALSCLIGASRILYAISKDRIFGPILHIFTFVCGKKKEPIAAVIASWFMVQLLLFIDKLNIIAPITTVFFLLSYAGVNVACLTLKVASAPNFRPTFQAYSRTTALLGLLASIAMMFVVNPIYAAVTLCVMVLLFMGLFFFGPTTPWGDVSQALIFYQVRKFLLRLDIRRSHVKFWRPQILLLVANPRSSYPVIDFTNDLKKGGLYVLGHVIKGPFNSENATRQHDQLLVWLNFVDISKVKAFVEITVAESFRWGAQSLFMTTGLGGMKPNTLAIGFFSGALPINNLDKCERAIRRVPKTLRTVLRDTTLQKFDNVRSKLPHLRDSEEQQSTSPEEYCQVLRDAITIGKNLLIMRHFENLDKTVDLKARPYIDVWPIKLTGQKESNTTLLVLQLSTVLHMVSEWNSLRMRVFRPVEGEGSRQCDTNLVCCGSLVCSTTCVCGKVGAFYLLIIYSALRACPAANPVLLMARPSVGWPICHPASGILLHLCLLGPLVYSDHH